MSDELEAIRALVASVEEYPPTDPESGEQIEGFLGKFVILSEWMDNEGNRYLVRKSANGMGEQIPTWDTNGLLFEGLFGRFNLEM